jgi:hypothetical protein
MKYIINDKQLFDAIYRYIDTDLSEDNINYDYGYNYDTDKTDKNIINFYGDKYSNNEQDDWYFEYVKKEYYENVENRDSSLKDKWLDRSPILEVIDYDFKRKLNSIFSEYWKPVFEKWFEEKFPQFPVKTYLY